MAGRNYPSDDERLYDSIGRRDVLKGATAAAATTAGAGAFAGTAAANDYDTVTVGANERLVVTVDAGETLENKLYDITASGATVVIAAHSTNWTIRNVGIRGYNDRAEDDAFFGVSDQSGNTSRMENVYLADGAAGSGSQTGIWVNPDHDGHIDFVNVNVQGMGDNGIYASAPGYNGSGGTHTIERCYAANNWVSQFRVGSAGDEIVDSCAELTADGYDGRGIWCWSPGTVTVRNTDVATRGRHYAMVAGANDQATSVQGYDFQYGNDGIFERYGSTVSLDSASGTSPDSYVPEGVPLTPEAAASGDGSGGGGGGDGQSLFYVKGEGPFSFEVSGSVEPHEDLEPWVTYGEHYGDDWVDNELSADPDTNYNEWWFTGEILSFQRSDGQTVEIDGTNLANLDDQRDFYVKGEGEFYLEVTGGVEPHEDLEPWVTYGEHYGDDWVDNELSADPDTNYNEWHYTGIVRQLDTTPGQRVEIDDEEVISG